MLEQEASPAGLGLPLLVVVTGPPASGKTTVARELAERFGVPYLSKDTIKERLYETVGSGAELEPRMERASLAVLLSIAESELRAGVSVLVESNFDADLDAPPLTLIATETGARVVQLHLGGPTEELVERFEERAESGERHPGHRDTAGKSGEVRERIEQGDWRPLDLPGEVVLADVADPVDIVVRRVLDLLTGR